MEPYRRRLQLDRQEILLLFCVFVLVSGLMFTLGLMMGYGMKARSVASAEPAAVHVEGHTEAPAEGEHHGKEPHEHASASHGEKSDKAEKGEKPAPETAAKTEADENRQKLSKALDADKQKALNEIALHEGGSEDPKSVQDAKAHFAATATNPTEKREPASVETPTDEKPVAKAEVKKGNVERVKGLFERKPAAIDRFAPTSGAYTVQIASFASEDESSAKVKILRQSGFNESYVQAIKLGNGEVWYRVAIGSYPSPVWAKKTGEKLVRRKLAGDFVIRKIP